ncbi:MAG: Pyrophosphate-energized proton pump [uncultured Chthoniobacterales bacterium]|uniref:K(+)-insensitive pyrophosphate-energized proton pump n=1 Tax=uncultured Chthoniobacterales bacterium TaxID=1836801 RepID=A0A6J4J2K4_9BACT|nr:MAG: Pyrophosphate-energized proton pump [uncultured Chthoniobacterales bacterium]
MFLAASILDFGVTLSMLCGVAGLVFAFFLIKAITSKSPGNERMREIAGAIEEGAKAYLQRQVVTISAIAAVIFILLGIFKDWSTAFGFLIGAFCSLAAGYIGMRIAVLANVRTAQAASTSRTSALRVAFNGGAVTGLLVVGLALLSVGLFYTIASRMIGNGPAITSLVGLALGSSLISVFARLGGGIYTKAADVGADLVGKIESNLDEDDPRNPATIADNVGDNVGDCAGMAADVFETYAVSLIGAILIGYLTVTAGQATDGSATSAVIYPFVLGGISVLGAILGIVFVNITNMKPAPALMGAVGASALVSAILFYPATHMMFADGIRIAGRTYSANSLYFAALVGLALTGLVVLITNYYTSTHYRPVRKIAEASQTGHATNIIAGLAIGQHATALPVAFIGLSILLSYQFAGLYGIAIAVMSMLSMAGIIISLDAFGPITDNAGGIAVMSDLPKEVRNTTDDLDAVGNTMKAVTKGYAIASAGLAALVLFGTYVEELRAHYTAAGRAYDFDFSLNDPKVIIGLFIGGLLPFIFTAFSMDAVGKAAGAVVMEVRRQLTAKPGILRGEDKPDYGTCVDIVTKAALREMIIPALLPVLFVVLVAVIKPLGPVVLGGMLVGTIVTGLFVAIAMTSSGGAWDNAKKYIEEGNLGGKGSSTHAASVTGDTVGDPYKDTAGPAINPMIKVVNIVAILIIPIFF